jgi:hypothetical protein
MIFLPLVLVGFGMVAGWTLCHTWNYTPEDTVKRRVRRYMEGYNDGLKAAQRKRGCE